MLAAKVLSAGRSGANGSDITSRMVLSSTFSTLLTGENRKPQEPSWSIARVSENTTSSAVSGEPSENLTPSRSVNSADRPSSATVQLVASSGSTPVPSSFSRTSRSYTVSSVKIERSSCVL